MNDAEAKEIIGMTLNFFKPCAKVLRIKSEIELMFVNEGLDVWLNRIDSTGKYFICIDLSIAKFPDIMKAKIFLAICKIHLSERIDQTFGFLQIPRSVGAIFKNKDHPSNKIIKDYISDLTIVWNFVVSVFCIDIMSEKNFPLLEIYFKSLLDSFVDLSFEEKRDPMLCFDVARSLLVSQRHGLTKTEFLISFFESMPKIPKKSIENICDLFLDFPEKMPEEKEKCLALLQLQVDKIFYLLDPEWQVYLVEDEGRHVWCRAPRIPIKNGIIN